MSNNINTNNDLKNKLNENKDLESNKSTLSNYIKNKDNSLFKKTGKISTSLDIILIVISFIAFFIAIIIDREGSIFEYVTKNIIAPGFLNTPIIDISFYNNKCPINYSDIDIYTFKQPFFNLDTYISSLKKNKKEYDLTNIKNNFNNIIEKYFNIKEKDSSNINQYNIVHMNGLYLSKFRSKRICIKRQNLSDYLYSAKLIFKDYPCPEGYKQCGLLSDLYKTKLCYKDSIKCPVNKINIRDYNINIDKDISSKSKYIKQDYEKIRLDDKVFEIFYSKTNSIVPFNLAISESVPCVKLGFIESSIISNVIFPSDLLNKDKLFCSISTNDYPYTNGYNINFKEIDKINWKSFLYDNDIFTQFKLIYDLNNKDIKIFDYTFMKLYVSGSIDFNLKCIQDERLDKKTTIKNYELIDSIYYLNFVKLKHNTFLLVLFTCLNIILLTSFIIFSSLVKINIRNLIKIFLILKLLCKFGFGILILIYSYKLRSIVYKTFNEDIIQSFIVNSRCISDESFENWKISNIDSLIASLKTSILLLNIFMIVYIVISIIFSLRLFYKIYIKKSYTNKNVNLFKVEIKNQ